MNEASSIFVDRLGMEKLINEKLMKVKHSPKHSFFINEEVSLDHIQLFTMEKSHIRAVETVNGATLFEIESFYKQQYYMENNIINLYYHPAANPECNVLMLHGLFDDNMANYTFLINQLNDLNFNVFFMVLPYHFKRKPNSSLFGGEFFFSADLFRTRNAFKQAVLDVEASMQFIGMHNRLPRRLFGFSMGGCVAFAYYLLKKNKVKTFLLNPVTELRGLAWDTLLLKTVGRDIDECGICRDEAKKVFIEIDPCKNIRNDDIGDNLTMAYSMYDQIIEKNKYEHFLSKTGIKNVIQYSAGHLNVLRVPRLSRDIVKFIGI
ncbi:MAG: alpha/beta hydrolase [Clostridia bacterium]|nr:alpha/beta hydrolase [Clostridia bacterium]